MSLRGIMRQEDLVQDPQGMFGLPDLPVCNALAFSQVSKEAFNILSGSVFQGFFRQKIGKVFRPFHIKWRTIRLYPVLLRAPPVSFPKNIALFGIAAVHDFHPGIHFYFNGLSKDHVLHARQNYNIMILFFCLLSVGKEETVND